MDICRVLDLVRPFFESRNEHLVAMKAQAFASDRTRYSDLAELGVLSGTVFRYSLPVQ